MATEEDKINTGALATIGAVLAISVVAVAFAVTALVRNEAASMSEEKGSSANLRPIQELRQQQTQAMTGAPVWVDKASNQVSLPIDRAQQIVIDEIRKDPGKATAPMPVDAAAPTAPDAGAATEDGGTAASDAGAATEPADGGAPVAPAPDAAPEGTEAPAPKPPKKPKQPKQPKPPTAPEPPPPEEGP